jgi:hypothetical protein
MDQRSDHIRQDIESTRTSLGEKLDSLESKARETFDLKHQVSERPWMALGAAVAAGMVVGSLGGGDEQRWHGQPMTTTDYNQHAYTQPTPTQYASSATPQAGKSTVDSVLSQFDDEIEMLKGAAISALTSFLHDSIRAYVPAMGQYLGDAGRSSATAPSTAPNTSYRSGAGSAGFDSPPATRGQSSQLTNAEAGGTASYYPPGSPGAENREYVKSYHPPSDQDNERAVGEENSYWREA